MLPESGDGCRGAASGEFDRDADRWQGRKTSGYDMEIVRHRGSREDADRVARARDGDQPREATAREGDAIAAPGYLHRDQCSAVVERRRRRQRQGNDRPVEKRRLGRVRDPNEALLPDHRPVLRVAERNEREIDLVTIEKRAQLHSWGTGQAEFHLRVLGAEPRKQPRQEGDGIVLRAAQADRAAERRAAHLGEDIVVHSEHRFGMGEESFARRC